MTFLIILFSAFIHRVRGRHGHLRGPLAYGLPLIVAGLGLASLATLPPKLMFVKAFTLPLVPALAFATAYMLRWNLPHGPFFTLGKGQANNRPSPPAFAFFDKIKHAFPNDYWGSIVVLLIMDLPFLAAGIVAGHPLAGLLAMLGSTGTYVFWFTLPLHDRGIDPTRYAEWTGGAVYGAFLLALMG